MTKSESSILPSTIPLSPLSPSKRKGILDDSPGTSSSLSGQITGIQSYFGFSGIKVFILNTQKSQDISFPAIETRYLTLQLTKDAPDEFPSFVLERLQVINSPTSDFQTIH